MPTVLVAHLAARRARTARRRGAPARRWSGGLAQRRTQLEARWRDCLEKLTELSLAYHEEIASARPEPAAGETSGRVAELAQQAVAHRQAMAEIEAALDRIATGRYGRCEQCGRPISAALLKVRPQARYCAPCGRRSSGTTVRDVLAEPAAAAT